MAWRRSGDKPLSDLWWPSRVIDNTIQADVIKYMCNGLSWWNVFEPRNHQAHFNEIVCFEIKLLTDYITISVKKVMILVWKAHGCIIKIFELFNRYCRIQHVPNLRNNSPWFAQHKHSTLPMPKLHFCTPQISSHLSFATFSYFQAEPHCFSQKVGNTKSLMRV